MLFNPTFMDIPNIKIRYHNPETDVKTALVNYRRNAVGMRRGKS
jgi:hypothetical protein